jgi:ubiquinone/menaquinone biosynthesis C-methylase UbiE
MSAGPCPETRFGIWLISSQVWRDYVVRDSLTDLVRLLGPPTPGGRVVLDVGCGVGGALPMLDAAFGPAALLGRDLDGELVRRAAVEAAPLCRAHVDLAVAAADRLDLGDATVDVIFCHQTLHHVEDPAAAVRELHRVLKPGGALLVAESCASFICSLRVRLLFRHMLHVQRAAGQWVALARATGFVVDPERVKTPYPWWSRPDFGLLELMGRPIPARHAEPVVQFVALKP